MNQQHIIVIAPSRSGHNWTSEMMRSWMKSRDKVHQFENVIPENYHPGIKARVNRMLPANEGWDYVPVIQVRDYLNWAASWIKYRLVKGNAYQPTSVMKLSDMWLKMAKEANKDTSHVGHHITLLYEEFVQNEAYRRSICGILGGDYKETKIDYVPRGGQGSSFDGYELQDKGSMMNVLERYKWFWTEEGSYYIEYLKMNKSVIEYYAGRFDLTPDKAKLVNEILN